MDFQLRDLREAKHGEVYAQPGQRVHWPRFHIALTVPPGGSITAAQEGARVVWSDPSIEAWLYLHDPDDILVSKWLDEAFTAGDEQLVARAPSVTQLDVVSRQFASRSFVGRKVTSDDAFGNGVSAIFSGPLAKAEQVDAAVTHFVRGVRFVHADPLDQSQVLRAITNFFNTSARTAMELFQYINTHLFLLRDDVVEIVDLLAKQAVKEQHEAATSISVCAQVLEEARRLLDAGDWEKTIAEIATDR